MYFSRNTEIIEILFGRKVLEIKKARKQSVRFLWVFFLEVIVIPMCHLVLKTNS